MFSHGRPRPLFVYIGSFQAKIGPKIIPKINVKFFTLLSVAGIRTSCLRASPITTRSELTDYCKMFGTHENIVRRFM